MKNSFRRLFVWEASVDLASRIVILGDQLIEMRRFALADQLIRAACSVPNNIAEGRGRSTTRDRRHFLSIARGSLYELETQLEIMKRAAVAEEKPRDRWQIAKIECGLTKMIDRLSL
jgi:four helix bundle protein